MNAHHVSLVRQIDFDLDFLIVRRCARARSVRIFVENENRFYLFIMNQQSES
jgi:hypothetical protein